MPWSNAVKKMPFLAIESLVVCFTVVCHKWIVYYLFILLFWQMETVDQWQGSWVSPLLWQQTSGKLDSECLSCIEGIHSCHWFIVCVELRWCWCHFTGHLESIVAWELPVCRYWKKWHKCTDVYNDQRLNIYNLNIEYFTSNVSTFQCIVNWIFIFCCKFQPIVTVI